MKQYLAYRYDGSAEGFETLTEAVQYAYNGMGSVWISVTGVVAAERAGYS